MATYISLVQFTDKGIHAAKETTQRVAEWGAKVLSKGVTIKHVYWTLGQSDQVFVFDAPSDAPGSRRVCVRVVACPPPAARGARFYQRGAGTDARRRSVVSPWRYGSA